MTTSLLVCFTALVIERLIGYPRALYRTIGHPVEYAGKLIARLETRLNRDSLQPSTRKLFGALMVALIIAVTGAAAIAVMLVLRSLPYGWAVEAVLAST
ncbi:MAG: cobalamin biosynthesis protein, partial [Aestuariivirgaceae bacterium]